MDPQILSTVIITLITVLGGNAAWKYYERRLNFKLEQRKLDSKDDFMHINDLRARIDKLEKLLKISSEEKDELRDKLVRLTADTSIMKTQLEYLTKENQMLRSLIGADFTEKIKPPRQKKIQSETKSTSRRKTNEK